MSLLKTKGECMTETEKSGGDANAVTAKKNRWWWPDVSDAKSAKQACDVAAYFGFASSILTAGFIFLGVLSGDAWFDLVSVTICASVLILKQSRVAAITLLGLFILSKMAQLSSGQLKPASVYLGLVFGLAYISGVRGSLSLHKINNSSPPPAANNPDEKSL